MQVDDDVLSGKKKLMLTTRKPLPEATEETYEFDPKTCVPFDWNEDVLDGKKMSDKENYYKAEIIGIDGNGGDWCEFWSEIEPIVDKYFGDEWCGSSKPNYDIEKYLRDGWIPCSERQPDKDGDYLVTEVMRETFSEKETGELMVTVEAYYTGNSDDGYGGWTYAGWQGGLRVIAWMECPKPYTETT